MNFGERLKQLRKSRGLTLEQLAKKFHMRKSTFSNYENNYRKPSADLIEDLADFFNVSVDYILCRSNEKENADKIKAAISDNEELLEFWEVLKERDDLQLMLKQTRDLPEDAIQDILRIIMRIEKEEGAYD